MNQHLHHEEQTQGQIWKKKNLHYTIQTNMATAKQENSEYTETASKI